MTQKPKNPTVQDLEEVRMQRHRSGDVASGIIYLKYETVDSGPVVYELEYDTVGGPDGLMTKVVDGEGETVHGEMLDENKHVPLQVPRQVHEHASKTLAYYKSEAVGRRGNGIGIGTQDDWLPTDS